MKKLKALIASITALCMCASNMSVVGQVQPMVKFISVMAKNVATSGTCGENLTWDFDTTTGILTISGTGEMKEYGVWYDSNGNPVYSGGSMNIFDWGNLVQDIKQVIIEDGVTTISDKVFYSCSALESVSIPDSVTKIGDNTFSGCSALESVIIPDGVTKIGDGTFSDCSALKSVTIPDSVTIIDDNAFEGCHSLEYVTIPDSVTTIGNDAFRGCIALTSVVIPDSVTTIGRWAFAQCFSLESVTISENITEISGYAFAGCPLESVMIPKNVTIIDNSAFTTIGKLENGEVVILSVKSITIENPKCEIRDSQSTISYMATIHGYENSTAQAYAEKYNVEFISLGEAPETPEIKRGDVNLDNAVDILDVITINKAILGQKVFTVEEKNSADVDNSGIVDPVDSLNIMKYIVKLIDNLEDLN